MPDLNDVYYATYASIYGDDPDQKVNELVDRYKEKTGKLPDTSAFLTGYAMVQAIQKAVEGADGSTEGSALQDQLQQFDNEHAAVADDVRRPVPHHPEADAAR